MSRPRAGTIACAVLAAAAATVLAVVGTVVVGIRTRNPTILGVIHRMQRDSINPRALASAGQPGSPHAILRHTGRVSGREYQTPVGAVVTSDSVTIALVYGTGADWARNVLSAGKARLLADGRELDLTDPQVLPLQETVLAGTMDLTALVLGITDALVLQIRTGAEPA